MKLKVYEDYEALSANVAALVIKQVNEKPASVLCFATGDTPKLAYQLIAEKSISGEADFSNCFFIGLDEWAGISPGNPGSCHWFLHHYIFEPMNISTSQIGLFNAMADDLGKECERMNKIIKQEGGIDLMLVGVGMNGHIGFNEPGTATDSLAHVAMLDETTLSVGKKYFNGAMETNKGVTLGLKHFMDSRNVIMMANGAMKAGIIKKVLETESTIGIPASLIQKHADALILLDSEAATGLDVTLIHEKIFQ